MGNVECLLIENGRHVPRMLLLDQHVVQAKRGAATILVFFSSTTLAGAFGGLLASAIGKMGGKEGYSGWR